MGVATYRNSRSQRFVWIWVIAATIVSLPGYAWAKPARVDASLLSKELLQKIAALEGQISVSVVDLERGTRAFDHHEHVPRNPASNAKLATAAAALEILGPHHTFATALYGEVVSGEVKNLVIRGRGDPTLSASDLITMAQQLANRGVRRVHRIEVDQSHFDDAFVPPGFEQQPDEWAAFRAPVAAGSVDGNVVAIRVYATKVNEPAQIVATPGAIVDLASTIQTGPKRSAEAVVCDPAPNADRTHIRCSGFIPDGQTTTLYRRLHDPRRAIGYSLAEALRGVGIHGPAPTDPDGIRLGGTREKRLLVAHRSKPVGSLMGLLGKESNNFAAEMLLKTLGAEDQSARGPATSLRGAEAIERVLRSYHAWEGGFRIVNGSGLFDANRATTFGLSQLLAEAEASPRIGAEFVAQLAIGGLDGTLRHRFEKWAKRRAIRAKSGTLAAVVALSGYVLAPEPSRPLAFSIVVEGVSGKTTEARAAVDTFVDGLAYQLWKETK